MTNTIPNLRNIETEPKLIQLFEQSQHFRNWQNVDTHMSETQNVLTALLPMPAAANSLPVPQSSPGFTPDILNLPGPAASVGADKGKNEWLFYYSTEMSPWQRSSDRSSISDFGDWESQPPSSYGFVRPTDRTCSQSPVSITICEDRKRRRQQQNRKAQRAYRERQALRLHAANEDVRGLSDQLDRLHRFNQGPPGGSKGFMRES